MIIIIEKKQQFSQNAEFGHALKYNNLLIRGSIVLTFVLNVYPVSLHYVKE